MNSKHRFFLYCIAHDMNTVDDFCPEIQAALKGVDSLKDIDRKTASYAWEVITEVDPDADYTVNVESESMRLNKLLEDISSPFPPKK